MHKDLLNLLSRVCGSITCVAGSPMIISSNSTQDKCPIKIFDNTVTFFTSVFPTECNFEFVDLFLYCFFVGVLFSVCDLC